MESIKEIVAIISIFPLGYVCMTPGVLENIPRDEQLAALQKHAMGDWGDLCEEDRSENELSLKEGFRVLSAYASRAGVRFWIITEADRSVTTLLLPEEY